MKTKKIALLGILMAINIAISFIYIPVGPNLRIYFTFILTMLVAANFSLKDCIIHAVLEDLISFFLFPTGPFFAGYTLTAVLSIVIYNLLLYKKVSLPRIIIAKALVNILINVCLGSFWSHILYSKAWLFYAGTSIIKNLLLLPIEVIIFFAVYKLAQPFFDKFNSKIGE